MDAREEFTRLMAWLVQNVDEMESSQIKANIDLLLGTASHLIKKVTDRSAALAKQCRPRKAKPPKAAPVRSLQQQKQPQSSTSSSSTQNASQKRAEELSSIHQGIRQADASLDDRQRNLRHFTYGQNDGERSLRLAAKAIAS